jgi:hypothetical protein
MGGKVARKYHGAATWDQQEFPFLRQERPYALTPVCGGHRVFVTP